MTYEYIKYIFVKKELPQQICLSTYIIFKKKKFFLNNILKK